MKLALILVAVVAIAASAESNSRLGRLLESIRLEADQVLSTLCTTEYAPVCGSDGRTYSNACRARLVGVSVQFQGECPRVTSEAANSVCVQIYEPVCGSDGKTYANSCFAEVAKVAVVSEGQCASTSSGTFPPGSTVAPATTSPATIILESDSPATTLPPRDICMCPRNYLPVCGVNGKTYVNKCESKCKKVEIAHSGEC